MSEFSNLFKPIMLIGFSIAIMLGLMSPKKLSKIFAMWVFGPILFAIILSNFKGIFSSVGYLEKFLMLLIAGLIIMFIISRIVPRNAIFEGVASNFVYDVLKFIALLPVKIIRGIFSILFKK